MDLQARKRCYVLHCSRLRQRTQLTWPDMLRCTPNPKFDPTNPKLEPAKHMPNKQTNWMLRMSVLDSQVLARVCINSIHTIMHINGMHIADPLNNINAKFNTDSQFISDWHIGVRKRFSVS